MSSLLIFGLISVIFLLVWFRLKGIPNWLMIQLHYLYLVRIPLIGGLIFFLFPLIAEFVAPAFLQNLFVVESDIQLIVVIFCATVSSIILVSTIKNILVLIDEERKHSQSLNENNRFRVIRSILSLLLVSPFLISLAFNSVLRNEDRAFGGFSFIVGLGLSLVSLALALIYDWRKSPLFNVLKERDKSENVINRRRKVYLIQLLIGLIIYVSAILLNWPKPNGGTFLPDNWQAPTLLYAILIIVGMTLIIGAITFQFDRYYVQQYSQAKDLSRVYTFRVPVILLLLLFVALSYEIFGVDHYFKLQDSQVKVNYEEDFKTAVGNRLCPEDFQQKQSCQEEQTLVVVAASGGGIQASGWMAQVLAGLQDEIGTEFTKNIGLISSVSGGSVGTMFYLDQFKNGILEDSKIMIQNATDDWLDSVGWGLAFPDLFRAIGLPWVLEVNQDYQYLDRGYSLEKDWQRKLNNPTETLDDWYEKAIKGEIPIPVFNSTIVENGRRFLVSPLKFLPVQMTDYLSLLQTKTNSQEQKNLNLSKEITTDIEKQKIVEQSKAFDFRTLYNNCGKNDEQMCTLAVTTASRLSATFPYVSPMTRNDRENNIKNENNLPLQQDYHVADGGYFDNAGAFTALEWLNKLLEENRNLFNIKKVVLVRINAFPDDQLNTEQQGNKGFWTVSLGPLTALNGVRNSTQIARNIEDAKLMKARWENEGIKIQRFPLDFPGKDLEGKSYKQPLSWRLTSTQKKNLQKAWKTDPIIRNTVKCLNEFWNSKEGIMDSNECEIF